MVGRILFIYEERKTAATFYRKTYADGYEQMNLFNEAEQEADMDAAGQAEQEICKVWAELKHVLWQIE